jgi:hypothetical protein
MNFLKPKQHFSIIVNVMSERNSSAADMRSIVENDLFVLLRGFQCEESFCDNKKRALKKNIFIK